MITCFCYGLIDLDSLVFGLIFIYTLIPSIFDSSRVDNTIAASSGKFIPKEVTTHTDTLQDIRQGPILALEQCPNEPRAMVPYQPSAPNGQSSKRSTVLARVSRPKKQLSVVRGSRMAVSKVQRYARAAALRRLSLRTVLLSFAPSPSPTLLPPSDSLLLGATEFSPILTPSSEETMMGVAKSEKENQAAVATDKDRSMESRVDSDALATDIQSVVEPVRDQGFVEAHKDVVPQIEPDRMDGPTDGSASLENDNVLQNDSETIETSTDGQTPTGDEDDGLLQTATQTIFIPTDDNTSVEAKVDEHEQIPSDQLASRPDVLLYDHWSLDEEEDDEELREVANLLDALLSRFSTSIYVPTHERIVCKEKKDVGSARENTAASSMRNRTTARNFQGRHVMRSRVASSRVHRPQNSRRARACVAHRKVMEKMAIRLQQAAAERGVEADGGMTGFTLDEQVEAQVEGEVSMGFQITSQQTGADSTVETEGDMVGVEAQMSVTGTDEVMIRSDVDGAMEVDEWR